MNLQVERIEFIQIKVLDTHVAAKDLVALLENGDFVEAKCRTAIKTSQTFG
jgi:hypothetical protein